MTTIKASCPVCGDVDLTPAQVRLVVCTVPDWSFYAFTCSGCHDEIRKPAGPDVVQLLKTGGVVVEPWVIPAEALERHDGPQICWDDVLDFALWLDSADLVASAAASITAHTHTHTNHAA
ncbi:MAG: hypothetical protein CSA58_04545 [Micrococcales bacterium]|nr:MAG: hypothetical protein CSA58_04545 [Micrococcales bacterium]